MSTNENTNTVYAKSSWMHVNGGQASGMGSTESIVVGLTNGQLVVVDQDGRDRSDMVHARASVELDVPAPPVWTDEHEALIVALSEAGWTLSVASLEGRSAPVDVDATPAAS